MKIKSNICFHYLLPHIAHFFAGWKWLCKANHFWRNNVRSNPLPNIYW